MYIRTSIATASKQYRESVDVFAYKLEIITKQTKTVRWQRPSRYTKGVHVVNLFFLNIHVHNARRWCLICLWVYWGQSSFERFPFFTHTCFVFHHLVSPPCLLLPVFKSRGDHLIQKDILYYYDTFITVLLLWSVLLGIRLHDGTSRCASSCSSCALLIGIWNFYLFGHVVSDHCVSFGYECMQV